MRLLRPIARPFRRPVRRQPARLQVEVLEQRLLLSTVSWDVDRDDLWDVPTNWRDDTGVQRLPVASDDVFLDRAAGPFTITHGSGSDTVHSLHADRSSFVLSGGSLAFSAGGMIDLDAGLFQWTGGTLGDGSEVLNAGFITLAGAGAKALGGTLNNGGTITHGGTGDLSGGAVNILTGGVYDLQADLSIPPVTNSGTLIKSGGTGTVTIHPFTNTGGIIDIRSGTLAVDGRPVSGNRAPTWTGANFKVAQGSVLDWTGEGLGDLGLHYDLAGNYTGSGAGIVRFANGRLGFGAAGGTFDFSPGLFQWSGTSGASEIDGGAAGLTNLGTITLTGASQKRLSNALDNAGTIFHGGTGDLVEGLNGLSVLTNLPGALYDLQADVSITNNLFINRGTLRKSGGTSTSSMKPLAFRNEGAAIDVQSGTLELASNNGSSTGGTFTVPSGAVLDLTGGQFVHYTGNYTGSGLGAVRLARGDLIVDVAGATFNFPAGLFQWSGGIIIAGPAGLNNVGTITLAGPNPKQLSGVLNNAGTIRHTGTGDLQDDPHFDGAVNNLAGALYDLQGDLNFSVMFTNVGTLRKSAGTGTSTSFGFDFQNHGGTVDVRTGTFLLKGFGSPTSVHTGGTFHVAQGAILNLMNDRFARSVFQGNYSGSGEGAVQLSAGTLVVGEGGVTFDFGPALFQWTGGEIDAKSAALTNRGTITVPDFVQPNVALLPVLSGALNNAGAISMQDQATLVIGRNGAGVLTNLAGGLFEFQGDGSLVRRRTDGATFINQGTLRKSSGPGTATIGSITLFSNTGTLAVDAGTVSIQSTTIAQVAGGTLTAGTWQIAAGSSLDLATAAAITTNNAQVILDGPGSTFAKLDTLANNSGSLSLLADRDFTTSGPLSNAGRLTIGANSTLNVAGTYSQTAVGTVAVKLGGDPVSGKFGQLTSSGAAALDGTFDVALADGFGPAIGQSFQVMSFPSHSGTFSAFTGLRVGRFPLFEASLSATDLFLNALTSTADLAFDSFDLASFPTSALSGQNVMLTYRVKNLSELPTAGDWIDSVYLSPDGVLDPGDDLLARVSHHGAVDGMGSYSETVTAALPPLANGDYRVIVLADSRGLATDANRGNNMGISKQAIAVTVPSLVLGTPLTGSVTPGQDLYYRVLVPPGQDITISAEFAALPGAELSVRYGALPDRPTFDEAAQPGQLHPRLLLTNAQGGTYYLHLRGQEDAAGVVAFTLNADVSGFEVTRVSPLKGSNLGLPAVLDLKGSQFTAQTRVRLQMAGGESRDAQSVVFINANRIVAMVDLTDLPTGSYQVVAEDAGRAATALETFTVTSSPPGEVGAFIWLKTVGKPLTLAIGGGVRSFANQVVAFGEFNTSDSPLPATLWVIRATNVEQEQEEIGSIGSDTVPPRVLPGGYYNNDVQIIRYKPKVSANHQVNTYDLYVIDPSHQSMEWGSQKDSLRPSMIPPDAWDAVWQNLRPQLGETLADFWSLLTTDSEKLAVVGERLVAIDELFNFELQKANNLPAVPVPSMSVDVSFPAPGLPLVFTRSMGDTIAGRYRLGRLGRGWTDNFDSSIHEDAVTHLVTISQGGSVRFFKGLDDGSYPGAVGEFATLTKVNGAFQLREATGSLSAFRTDGLLDYLEDTNGNRITAGYTGDQMTSLTHSSGAALTLSYEGARLHQVTDPAGGVTTYEYDASGKHLVRVTTTAGTTEYAYTPDADGPGAHALASITYLDGTHLFFDYDGQGRLVRLQGDGGTGMIRFAYDVAGFAETNAENQVTTFLFDDSFRIRRVIDPLGRVSTTSYDASNQLLRVEVGEGGTQSSLNWSRDAMGNPTSVQDSLGETQAFTYEPDPSRPETWQDALGHETQYDYDAQGNLTATTQMGGSTRQHSYNAQGNVVRTVNPLGQNIGFTYNGSGQVTRKGLPDGTHVDYTYNARGNLETVADASGTTRLDYLDANPDLLTKITYPSGRFLEYTYQNGRRTRIVDQGGFAVNYSYDAAGRLDVLTDGGGSLIVDYDYNPVGRLARETHGNGTVTQYEYDSAGQLLKINNLTPGGAVESQSVYTYDNLGRRTSETTEDGVTTYGYDGVGRLTEVALPTGPVVTYAYDAAGNRMASSDGSANTNYAVNDLNQYVAFGSTAQTFDAAGNLLSSSSSAGSTSYRYDVEGRLVSQITPTGTWTYEYDALGNRIATTHDGVRTEYLVDPSGLGNVVAEYDGAGNLQAHYVDGIGLTSRVDAAGTAAYYQFDAVGNTTRLTGTGGAVLNTYRYLPFGENLGMTETVANPFEYVGQFGVMREGSGIDYMRHRWYAPTQGRFTQPDPIGLGGGTNFYAYAGNNPVSLNDPSGLVVPLALAFTLITDAAFASPEIVALMEAADLASAQSFAAANAGYFASLAAPAAAPVIGPSVLEYVGAGALGVLGAAELLLFINAVAEGAFYWRTGEIPACTPVIPHSLQACDDPGSHVLENVLEAPTFIMRLIIEQISPSEDPNDIAGPVGFGPEGFLIPQAPLSYLINFQNKPEAIGPAEEVVVTQNLDPNLDLDTFELGEFGFGDLTITVPPGRQFYSTRIDLRSTRGVFVDVTAQLDRATRTATWRFDALDPETMDLPSDPSVGFLPPDKTAPEGEGYVEFSIRAKAGLPTGTSIHAQATIVFDTNAPLDTNVWTNTLDAGPPTSTVDPLPAVTNSTSFTVTWSGSDDADGATGSGIATFDVFVSDNTGTFQPWLDDTTEHSAMYSGESDHTYRFYSVASDNLGHVQTTSGTSQAQITVDTTSPILANLPPDQTIEATMSAGAPLTFTPPTASDNLDSDPVVSCAPNSGALFPLGTTPVICTATDDAGNSQSATFTVTVQDTTPPVLAHVPTDVRVEVVGLTSAAVSYTQPMANDVRDPNPAVSCNPARASMFSYGATTVTCSATDSQGNASSASFTVTVEDTISPVVAQFKLQKDARGRKVTDLLLNFSEEVSGATALANYVVLTIGRRPKPMGIASATYDVATHTARLHLLKPLSLSKLATTQLRVRGNGTLADLASHPLDGDLNGTAGGDFVRTLNQGLIAAVLVDSLLDADALHRTM